MLSNFQLMEDIVTMPSESEPPRSSVAESLRLFRGHRGGFPLSKEPTPQHTRAS